MRTDTRAEGGLAVVLKGEHGGIWLKEERRLMGSTRTLKAASAKHRTELRADLTCL